MSQENNVDWICIHSFNEIDKKYDELRGKEGVYLWVYRGIKKRIIYTGTGIGVDGLFRRLCIEKAGMLSGRHYCFQPNPDIDPYENLKKSTTEIKRMLIDGQFYIPDISPVNDNRFTTETFIEYQKRISIYVTDLSSIAKKENTDIGELSKVLETQIQVYLLAKENIGYYRKWGFQSWLGRVEKLSKKYFEKNFEELVKHRFSFTLPEIEGMDEFLTEICMSDIKNSLEKDIVRR